MPEEKLNDEGFGTLHIRSIGNASRLARKLGSTEIERAKYADDLVREIQERADALIQRRIGRTNASHEIGKVKLK